VWAQGIKDLVFRVGSAVVFVEVRKPNGDTDIGSAFHIGDGFFATARHVIEGNEILSVGRHDTSVKTHSGPGGQIVYSTTHPAFRVQQVENQYYHPEPAIDAAIIKLAGRYEPTLQMDPAVATLTEGEFLMEEVVVLGYPPIPFSADVHLVVFRGEVSAVLNHRIGGERYFVVSGMARGGFSGGPIVAVRNPAVVLGLVSHSLVQGDRFMELGFIGGLSAKAIFETVDYCGLPITAVQRTYRGFIEPERPTQ